MQPGRQSISSQCANAAGRVNGRGSAGLCLGLVFLVFAALAIPGTAHAVDCVDEAFVSITDTGFVPDQVCVLSGGRVHWTNDSSAAQTVTNGMALFEPSRIEAGGRFSMTIEVAGAHAYSSLLQSALAGEVVVAVTQLAGNDDDLADDNIPDLPFPSMSPDDISLHPVMLDDTSRTHILLGFLPEATVAEANDALTQAGVAIAGGLPRPRMLLVLAPDSGDFTSLTAALDVLRGHPAIEFAALSSAV